LKKPRSIDSSSNPQKTHHISISSILLPGSISESTTSASVRRRLLLGRRRLLLGRRRLRSRLLHRQRCVPYALAKHQLKVDCSHLRHGGRHHAHQLIDFVFQLATPFLQSVRPLHEKFVRHPTRPESDT
ncbi:hypothetical protein M758_1G276800, partial [Ceratodon purpureus]